MESQSFQRHSLLANYKIEEFKKEEHLEFLLSWLRARNKGPEVADNLPAFGYIAYHHSRPVATAFLRQVEGNLGICEGLCTNPEASSNVRSIAIDSLIEQLIETAKAIDIKALIAWSQDKNTLERSVRHGFNKTADELLVFNIVKSIVH